MLDFTTATMSDIVAAVVATRTTPKMQAFFDTYVAYLLTTNLRPGVGGEDVLTVARDIARENIGWCYGEGMPPSQVRLWRETTGAEHPAGKIEDMTLDEIFEAGKRWGEESKGKLEAPGDRAP